MAADSTTWPTPRCSDGMTGKLRSVEPKLDRGRLEDRVAVTAGAGRYLSPDWEELLMGWPLGWSALDPMNQRVWDRWTGTWGDDWEGDTPRTTPEKVPDTKTHKARTEAIGNGQVPLCAATAWRLLTQGT